MVWNLGHRAGQRLRGKKDAGGREGHVETSQLNRRVVNNPCDHEETGTQQGMDVGDQSLSPVVAPASHPPSSDAPA